MKRATIISLAAALAATAVTALSLGVAGAHKGKQARIDTNVKITKYSYADGGKFGQFSGKVKGRGGCQAKRKIVMLGPDGDGGLAKMGTGQSNRQGRWTVEPDGNAAGDWYARATRSRVRNNRHRHLCKPGRSDAHGIGLGG